MTATSIQVRPAPAGPSRLAEPLSLLHLLRIELRRSPMPLILPLIAALFWFDSYRPSVGMPPLFILRTFWNMGQGHTIVDFGPFVAGMAAWIGSRDGRRGTADLVTATARPRWSVQLVTWAAAAIWAVAGYLACVGVMFGVYAHQGVTGEPPWWWVAVGGTAVAGFSAAGFAAGVYFPTRFTAPLAAFGGFFLMLLSSQTGFNEISGWYQILPTDSNGNFQPDSGMLYPYLPDIPIVRIMFLAGIGVAVLGLLGLPAGAAGRRLRGAAVVLVAAGVASTVTAVGFASTARLGPHGMAISLLHDSASDRPIRYAPICDSAAGMPVCLNPAYRNDLTTVTAALAPVVRELAGLPGAPGRARQIGASYDSVDGEGGQPMTISGTPAVLSVPLGAENLLGAFGATRAQFSDQLQLLFLHAFVGAGNNAGTPAQQAVQAALLQGAGMPIAAQPRLLTSIGLQWIPAEVAGGPTQGPPQAIGPVYAAARRFAALPAAARQAWLASHLTALRSGALTLAQLP
jgi:hypothetical protein